MRSLFYFANTTLPSKYANSHHVMRMCEALSKTGSEVVLYVTVLGDRPDRIHDFYGTDGAFEIRTIPYPSVKGNSHVFALSSWWEILRNAPDVVFTRFIQTALFSMASGFRTILETHHPYQELRLSTKLYMQGISKMEGPDKLIVISEALRELYEESGLFPPETIEVVPDAASEPQGSKTVNLRGEGDTNVGYTGSLYEGRGIKLISELARKNPDLDFHVVGGMEKQVEEWTKKTDDIENLYFYGFQPPQDIGSFQKAMDILLAPYQKKVSVPGGMNTVEWMSPLKIFEYMAAGKPIISSNLSAIKEILDDEETALLVNSGSVEAWDSAVNRLVNNIGLRENLSENAYQEFTENFTWEKRVEKILSSTGTA